MIRRLLLILLLFSCMWTTSLAMSEEEEIQLGAQAAARFEAQYGLVNDPAMVGRLNRVGRSIIANAQRKNLPWRFRVVNVDAFNAAAFPGGFVYATRGLMQNLNDEELAFVVGHEIGHVEYQHSIKQLESGQLRKLGLILIAAGASGGNIDNNVSRLVQLTDAVISSQYSREDESEADRFGMAAMAKAGYDPAYAIAALQILAAQSSGGTPGFLNTLLGSHPLPKDRITQGYSLILDVPYSPPTTPPVNPPTPGNERIYRAATDALEYTLSLQGQGHRDSLQSLAEDVALGRRQAPGNVRVVRVTAPESVGLSGLENNLMTRPEFDTLGQAFGAAVVDAGNGQTEAVVLLQGGR